MAVNRFWLTILAVIAAAPAFAAESKEAARRVYVSAPIEVAADGHAEIGEVEGVSGQLAQFARTLLSTQRYLPARREGQPVVSSTRVELALNLVPVGDRFEISLASVRVGPPGRHLYPPDYPVDMARRGKESVVLLRVQVGPEGRAIDSAAIAPTDRAFAQAAIRASRDWRFDPLLIDGKPASYEVIQPVWFHERERRQPPTPDFQCPSSDSVPRAEGHTACRDHIEVVYWHEISVMP